VNSQLAELDRKALKTPGRTALVRARNAGSVGSNTLRTSGEYELERTHRKGRERMLLHCFFGTVAASLVDQRTVEVERKLRRASACPSAATCRGRVRIAIGQKALGARPDFFREARMNVGRVSPGDELGRGRWWGKALKSRNPMSGCGMKQGRAAA
jgi:hypothetical protein